MYNKYIKRVIDIIVSATALIIFSPICILISIMIKVIDKSPILYKQYRTGLHGKNFKIYKFTTMKNGEVTNIR
ncbi:MAG: sugar transferase [Clostridia bacterium]|nr:sugar transferase [Clostridia bacterium]